MMFPTTEDDTVPVGDFPHLVPWRQGGGHTVHSVGLGQLSDCFELNPLTRRHHDESR